MAQHPDSMSTHAHTHTHTHAAASMPQQEIQGSHLSNLAISSLTPNKKRSDINHGEYTPLSALLRAESHLEDPTERARIVKKKTTKHEKEKQPTCLILTLLLLEQFQLVWGQ